MKKIILLIVLAVLLAASIFFNGWLFHSSKNATFPPANFESCLSFTYTDVDGCQRDCINKGCDYKIAISKWGDDLTYCFDVCRYYDGIKQCGDTCSMNTNTGSNCGRKCMECVGRCHDYIISKLITGEGELVSCTEACIEDAAKPTDPRSW